MVLAYPSTLNSSDPWTLSPRVAHGHSQPHCQNTSAIALAQLGFVAPASESGVNSTVVSFTRPLEYGDEQQLVWNEGRRFLQLVDRGEGKKVTWAFGLDAPPGGSLTETVGMQSVASRQLIR